MRDFKNGARVVHDVHGAGVVEGYVVLSSGGHYDVRFLCGVSVCCLGSSLSAAPDPVPAPFLVAAADLEAGDCFKMVEIAPGVGSFSAVPGSGGDISRGARVVEKVGPTSMGGALVRVVTTYCGESYSFAPGVLVEMVDA